MSNSSSSSSKHGVEHCFVDQKIQQKYRVLNKIGSGAYGHVWKVACNRTNQILAIKKVFLALQNETDAQRVYREVSLLSKLRHNNIIKLKQVISSDNNTDLYLVFEYLESDLFKAIKNRVLNAAHKKFIVYQLACALKYLHSAGVLHRDLKPSNILLNTNCQIKLCDFGLSCTLKSSCFINPLLTEFIATRWYRSPEVILGSKSYTTKSDMWSLGCLIYELYSRRTLMPGDNTIDQITKMLQFKGKPSQSEVQSFRIAKASEILSYFNVSRLPLENYYADLESQQIKDVLNHLFEYDQNKRWSADELLESKFLSQFKNSLPQNTSPCPITIDLNDNKKYGVGDYKSEILNIINVYKAHTAKDNSKREFLSNRKHYNSLSLHSLAKRIKAQLQTTIRDKYKIDKKYQSVHVSPSNRRSLQKTVKKGESKILRDSLRKNVASSSILSIQKMSAKSKNKQVSFINKNVSGSKLYKNKVQKSQKNIYQQKKGISQHSSNMLKRGKLNCYRGKGLVY